MHSVSSFGRSCCDSSGSEVPECGTLLHYGEQVGQHSLSPVASAKVAQHLALRLCTASVCNCAEPFSASRRVWGCWLPAWCSGCHTRRVRCLHKHVFVLYSICAASAAYKRRQATPHPGRRALAHCHRACLSTCQHLLLTFRVESHMMHHVSVDAHALHHMMMSSCYEWEHDSCHLPSGSAQLYQQLLLTA